MLTPITAASTISGDAAWATFVLLVMCGIMYALARLAKKRLGVGTGTMPPDALKIVGKRPLDQKSSLWVVEIAGRYVLLGSGADGTVSKVDDISGDEYDKLTEESDQPSKLRALAGVASGRSTPRSDNSDAGADSDADEPRFATVGESFQMLLGRAKQARSASKASGE